MKLLLWKLISTRRAVTTHHSNVAKRDRVVFREFQFR